MAHGRAPLERRRRTDEPLRSMPLAIRADRAACVWSSVFLAKRDAVSLVSQARTRRERVTPNGAWRGRAEDRKGHDGHVGTWHAQLVKLRTMRRASRASRSLFAVRVRAVLMPRSSNVKGHCEGTCRLHHVL
eukprot:6553550-Prymnesium_polylepis.2